MHWSGPGIRSSPFEHHVGEVQSFVPVLGLDVGHTSLGGGGGGGGGGRLIGVHCIQTFRWLLLLLCLFACCFWNVRAILISMISGGFKIHMQEPVLGDINE